jgi:hypothetical protein
VFALGRSWDLYLMLMVNNAWDTGSGRSRAASGSVTIDQSSH